MPIPYRVMDERPGEDRTLDEREANRNLIGRKVLIEGYILDVAVDQPGGIDVTIDFMSEGDINSDKGKTCLFFLSSTKSIRLADEDL